MKNWSALEASALTSNWKIYCRVMLWHLVVILQLNITYESERERETIWSGVPWASTHVKQWKIKWNKSNRCRVVAVNGSKRIKRSKIVIHSVFVRVDNITTAATVTITISSIHFVEMSWTMTVSYLNDNNFYLFGMFWRWFSLLLSFRIVLVAFFFRWLVSLSWNWIRFRFHSRTQSIRFLVGIHCLRLYHPKATRESHSYHSHNHRSIRMNVRITKIFHQCFAFLCCSFQFIRR